MPPAVPPGEGSPAHTSTHQWQSFEMRMRQRRIDRLVVRAQVAHEAGFDADARDALAEIERLSPHAPALEEIRALLARPAELLPAAEPPAAFAATESPAVGGLEPEPAPWFDVATIAPDESAAVAGAPDRPRRGRSFAAALAVAAVLAVAAGGGWLLLRAGGEIAPAPAAPALPPPADAVSVATTSVAAAPAADEPSSPPAAPGEPAETTAPARPQPLVGRDAAADRPTSTTPPARAPRDEAIPPAVARQRPDTAELATRTTGTSAAAQPTAPTAAPRAEMPFIPPPAPPPAAPAASLVRALPSPVAAPPDTGTLTAAAPGTRGPSKPEAAAGGAATAPAVSPEAGVRATLSRYENAYSRLDADAAAAVWPGLDRGALARAFDGLESQQIRLGRCDVRVAGDSANVECAGTASWTPKVGGGSQSRSRVWQFRLRQAGEGWEIVRATVR